MERPKKDVDLMVLYMKMKRIASENRYRNDTGVMFIKDFIVDLEDILGRKTTEFVNKIKWKKSQTEEEYFKNLEKEISHD